MISVGRLSTRKRTNLQVKCFLALFHVCIILASVLRHPSSKCKLYCFCGFVLRMCWLLWLLYRETKNRTCEIKKVLRGTCFGSESLFNSYLVRPAHCTYFSCLATEADLVPVLVLDPILTVWWLLTEICQQGKQQTDQLDRTALEKCAHLYDETQGTIKHKRFRQRVFLRCKKVDRK